MTPTQIIVLICGLVAVGIIVFVSEQICVAKLRAQVRLNPPSRIGWS